MDATTRWETEAMRSSPQKRSKPPRPTAKRQAFEPGSGTFVTLKEAEDATGIPTNTLRKWVRKNAINSYLESDGELTLRMVEIGSIKQRAQELGRDLRVPPSVRSDERTSVPPSGGTGEPASQGGAPSSVPPSVRSDERTSVPPSGGTGEPASQGGARAGEPRPPSPTPDLPEGSMLVPIDAWNKMLNQLGNLHEAGQQLAEARERAAKAETEASFLRERLAEVRRQKSEVRSQESSSLDSKQPDTVGLPKSDASPLQGGRASEASQGGPQTSDRPETTSYWRYLTSGWRSRQKKR